MCAHYTEQNLLSSERKNVGKVRGVLLSLSSHLTHAWTRLERTHEIRVYGGCPGKSPSSSWQGTFPHFPWLCSWGSRRKERAHGTILVWRARLCLWSDHADAADEPGAHASVPGRAPGGLAASGGGLGGRQQLSQSPPSQTPHYPGRATAGLSLWTGGRGDPGAVESGAPEGAPG